jgi:hypothetical protein
MILQYIAKAGTTYAGVPIDCEFDQNLSVLVLSANGNVELMKWSHFDVLYHWVPSTGMAAVRDSVVDSLISKGDYPGHPFRGNQWTGGIRGGFFMAPDRGAGTGGGIVGRAKGKEVTTSLGKVRKLPDADYEITRGTTTKDAKAQLANTRGSFSQAINPATGHRMSNTELGDTMEALLVAELPKNAQATKVLGGSLTSLVGPSGPDGGASRQGAIDLVTSGRGSKRGKALEAKTLSMQAADPKVSIKPDEVRSKAKAAREMEKDGGILVSLFDNDTQAIRVFLYDGNPDFLPTTREGRIQIKMNQSGWQNLPVGTMVPVAEVKVTKSNWTKAQKQAGWHRDKDGKLPASSGSAKVVKQEPEMSDENDIEEGDIVIGLAGDGTPYVAWAGEPTEDMKVLEADSLNRLSEMEDEA